MLLWNDRADRNNVEVVQDQGRIPLMKPNIIVSIVMSVTVVASGCKVGPDYLRPAAPVSHEYIDAEDPRLLPEPDPHCAWWVAFNDPALNQLIEATHQQNLTLRAAGMRILEARARLGVARGNKFPQLQEAFAEYGRVNLSTATAIVFPVQDFDNWGTGFNAAWELDFWGRFERAIEASEAGLDANVENYDDILVILLGEVARTYVQMRTFEERLRLAEENVRIQKDTLALVQDKFDNGAVSELDVHQARQNLKQTEALMPLFRTGVRQSNNALCTLVGIAPRNLLGELGAGAPIPSTPPTVAVGIPGELLSRRPDVRRAERLLASQSAKIGVATADLYPRIGITGTIQVEAESLSDLFSSNAFAGLIGPGLRWNILNYGRILNSIRAEDAVFQRLAYEYQQTVLNANQEVEDAIVAFLNSQDRVGSLEESVKSAESSLKLVVDQYRLGTTDFNRVFLQQTELVRQQDQLAEARGERAGNLITVYKALGGGWQIRLGGRHQPAETIVNPESIPDLVPPSGDRDEAETDTADERGDE